MKLKLFRKRNRKNEVERETEMQLELMLHQLKLLKQEADESDKDFIRRQQQMRIESFELLEKVGKFREKKRTIDWNTIIIGGLSLIEIILIIGVENVGELITSKAFSRALRGRV